LVSGLITTKQLRRAIYVVAPFALLFNLLGPLGLKGGSLYLLGVGLGVSYNFYFKSTLLSPLPYALAFAALVSSIVIATDQNVPIWLVLSGALFRSRFNLWNQGITAAIGQEKIKDYLRSTSYHFDLSFK
jgi:hypothetical protein